MPPSAGKPDRDFRALHFWRLMHDPPGVRRRPASRRRLVATRFAFPRTTVGRFGFCIAAPFAGKRRSGSRIDESNTAFRIVTLAQMRWALGQNDLEGGPHLALDQMSGQRRP